MRVLQPYARGRVVVGFLIGAITGPWTLGCAPSGEPGASSPSSLGTLLIVLRLPEVSARVVPAATRFVRATVSGTGIEDPIVRELALDEAHGSTATLEMDVPSGTDRALSVQAFDSSLQLLAAATTSVDIRPGTNQPVGVSLEPEPWIIPTASASADPTSVAVGAAVSFSGTASDADGAIALYEWDFDGGGTYDISSATSPSTVYRFYSARTYTAVLRVTDNDGLTATDTVQVTVY